MYIKNAIEIGMRNIQRILFKMSEEEKELMKDFEKLIENNKDKDWNDNVFRETIANAFTFTAIKYIERSKKL